MASMTKGEYLASLRREAQRAEQAASETNRRRRMALILALGTFLILITGVIGSSVSRRRAYSRYVAGDMQVQFSQLDYQDTFAIWNERDVGNDVNTLLGGGKTYCRNDITVLPSETGFIVARQGQPLATLASHISYINVMRDSLFYRDDSTRQAHLFHLSSGTDETLLNGNIGQLFATGDRLYYIDHGANSQLFSISLNGGEASMITERPIISFAVCGRTVVYLDTQRRLYQKDVNSGSESRLLSHIERFYLNGNIIAESGDKIFQLSPDGRKSSLLYESATPNLQLVGANQDGIYYQENGALYVLRDSGAILLFVGPYDLYQSICVDNDGRIYCMAYNIGGQTIPLQLLPTEAAAQAEQDAQEIENTPPVAPETTNNGS